MGLDTRGFMDGALRAFDVADRYMERKEDRALRNQENQERRESREQQMSLQQAEERRRQQQFEHNYGKDGQGGALREKEAREQKLVDSQLETQQEQRALSEYQLGQQKRASYIRENLPVIQNSWKRWIDTGEIDPILDNEMIAGGAYDPRRYLQPEVVRAGETLENKLPAVLDGNADFNDPELKEALNTFYSQNIKASIGQKDPRTGRVIKDARWGGVTLAADINPELDGDQPGLVITTEVNYGDGRWVPKPVTDGRGTADEQVKVIPLEKAMRDLTGQLEMRRRAMASPAYKSVFGSKDEMKGYKEEVSSIESDRSKALAKLYSEQDGFSADSQNPDMLKRKEDEINRIYDQRLSRIAQHYGGEEPKTGSSEHQSALPKDVEQWASRDPRRQYFLQAVKQKGTDLSGYDLDTIERAFNDQLAKHKAEKSSEVASKLRTQL
ncbi:hypothetical protein [Salinivibrio sp. YCSC6]|uniref:hypothetical protein n=1 Tax=Salinivibrio sp. YCSC6 TaxID=2003370 RepID=UPI000BBC17F6|nr:hypothetical protein [Salinivibrio sp. YCSC6]PCE67524.1 hypothetical protein B6G00_04025 [Salinivibrio sp. YCSC6]QCF35569.1 hypothetical protein E8E00_04925 [Salinivibrio sp. YCSC6]